MSRLPLLYHACAFLVFLAGNLGAAEGPKPPPRPEKAERAPAAAGAKSVEQIAEAGRKSVVVITFTDRDGKRLGLGTGFVVAADGLIATNLHVLGEARPIAVQLADGKRYDVTSVHASDRALDLALIRIDAKNLKPLELGDSDTLKQGQAVVALGNPQGLEHSVVSGVVSAKRAVEDRPMIQVAIPIESGNSGGPLLDMHGRVQGIITMKSQVTPNLGFAMPINALKPLIEKPNPIPMARWLTIGALDPQEWKPLRGARWRQRAGRIQVDGLGSGFGGRSLCLWQRPLLPLPFEVAVTVRLEDEAGAAGLVFHADGGDKHYGFYPSAGQLRLTRFDGPDVLTWKILSQQPSPHYRPGEWNTLKVRLEKDRIRCYVNDHLVIESTDDGFTSGKVGLAKFRDTVAEFKQFQVAKQVGAAGVPADVAARISKSIQKVPAQGALKPELVESLLPDAGASMTLLRERARLLEQQAAQLRQLATALHQKRVQKELAKVLEGKEDDIDLLRAALLVARLDNDELDVDAYCKEVDRLAREVTASFPKGADEKAKLAALNKYLFTERGFHGGRVNYYTRSNSYLNEVLDDREGLPLTLSILYMEVARRLGLRVVGLGLPGHFVVQHIPAKGEPQLIDVFDGGKMMSRADANKIVQLFADRPISDEDLEPARKKAIIVRMLQNLLRVAGGKDKDLPGALRYLDAILAIAPDSAQERWMRAVLRFQTGEREGALEDADWLLKQQPADFDLERVRELRRALQKEER
jgi:regulator of sirC expression with transglutaminase-like and TPR domain